MKNFHKIRAFRIGVLAAVGIVYLAVTTLIGLRQGSLLQSESLGRHLETADVQLFVRTKDRERILTLTQWAIRTLDVPAIDNPSRLPNGNSYELAVVRVGSGQSVTLLYADQTGLTPAERIQRTLVSDGGSRTVLVAKPEASFARSTIVQQIVSTAHESLIVARELLPSGEASGERLLSALLKSYSHLAVTTSGERAGRITLLKEQTGFGPIPPSLPSFTSLPSTTLPPLLTLQHVGPARQWAALTEALASADPHLHDGLRGILLAHWQNHFGSTASIEADLLPLLSQSTSLVVAAGSGRTALLLVGSTTERAALDRFLPMVKAATAPIEVRMHDFLGERSRTDIAIGDSGVQTDSLLGGWRLTTLHQSDGSELSLAQRGSEYILSNDTALLTKRVIGAPADLTRSPATPNPYTIMHGGASVPWLRSLLESNLPLLTRGFHSPLPPAEGTDQWQRLSWTVADAPTEVRLEWNVE